MTPRKLLEALAPADPINDDEQGGCVWCQGMPPGSRYGYAGRFLSDHAIGCPWVKARRLLGDKLPTTRAYDHTKVKAQHAKGAKVQYMRDPGLRNQWCDCENPSWDVHTPFRVKPEL